MLTVRDVFDQGYRPSALRYALISTHYRKQLRFTWENLIQAEEALTRLMDCLTRLERITEKKLSNSSLLEKVVMARGSFEQRMRDDLNTPGALGVVFELVRDVNAAVDAETVGQNDAKVVTSAFYWFDQVLGVIQLRRMEETTPPVPVSQIEALIGERAEARRRHDFTRADSIRDNLEADGILLEDSVSGTHWKRK